MNRKGIIPLALASGFERVEKEYQFMPDTYEVSASDLELFVEKLTRKLEQEPVATVTGWYGGHPVIEPIDGWIPTVGTVLYSAPDNLATAAPDLLQALEGLLDCAIHGFDMPNDNQFALNARAAIERAHGIGEP